MAPAATEQVDEQRGGFSSRRVFILAAIGSAVGLGNIWRFPYVAYENGGGAFILPYLVALFVAGIPFLFLDYAIGHRNRGAAPLSWARLSRGAEGLGWWQVAICFFIAVYYAAIIAWASMYTWFSMRKSWGDDPEGFLFGKVLKASKPGVTMDIVPGVFIPLVIVWVVLVLVLALGVQKGVGATSVVFIPLLIVVFGALVLRALFLPGAAAGLDALFSPSWSALSEPGVWAAAFGQIFFSLSIGFGIMITYSSYVKRKTNMTGSAMVVGLSNSGFELLAGIGVFSVLGFMAQNSGQEVGEVASSGIGLAFVAFPAIISEAPMGSLLGVLFFASLVMAGITSLISIMEVVISAVRDKFEMSRVASVLVVGVPTAVISVFFFGTTSAIHVLDIVDHFVNQFGILLVAVVSMVLATWAVNALPLLARHLNLTGSWKLGRGWYAMIGVITPLVLGYVLLRAFIDDIKTPYGDYPAWMLLTFGWGAAFACVLFAQMASAVPWRSGTSLEVEDPVVAAPDVEPKQEVSR